MIFAVTKVNCIPIYVSGYTFEIKKPESGEYTGIISVTHYGLPGRICSDNWDDDAALVLCRNKGFQKGIAYHHADNEFAPLLGRGPFWMRNISCTEDISSLEKCQFEDRFRIANCSNRASAAVLCYNEDGRLNSLFNQH